MTSLPMLSDWHQTVYVYHRTRRQWQRCREEFDAFLECGILAHGFLRLRCADCALEKLVLDYQVFSS